MSERFFVKRDSEKPSGNQIRRLVAWINLFLVLIALYASWVHYRSRSAVPSPGQQKVLSQMVRTNRSLVERFTGTIKRNMTLSDVLSSYEVPEGLMDQLMVATQPIYDLKRLLVGNRFELERLPDGTLKQFLYEVDPEKNLKVYLTQEGYRAALEPIGLETRLQLVAGTIQGSLFRTINELNEGDQLALELAEIFSWDFDFNSELRQSDHFKVAVEKKYLNGQFLKYGKILAAEFSNRGRLYSAFYFSDQEGYSGYYNAAGQSLKRSLLKAPIKFSRITSVFTRKRFHPLLNEYRPHMGVDYAAQTGTPVYAAGNGRVEFAGWRGGLGRSIELSHQGGLSSMYGHLSRFATGVYVSAQVKQGQVIGYVGATGLATGPHLDYRILRNGKFVNPVSLRSEPSVPIKSEYQAEFQAQRERWQREFATLEFSHPPQFALAGAARH
jgi:murein DD-endopeptidase MepM/ murein hydrolase activator NlpD